MVSKVQIPHSFYETMAAKIEKAKQALGLTHMTAAEKLLFAHAVELPKTYVRGQTMLRLQPDRVAMQDATAQMAITVYAIGS
jgi:hypothetical protein